MKPCLQPPSRVSRSYLSVSWLVATAELPSRPGDMSLLCEEEQRLAPDGKLLCLECDQPPPKLKRTVFVASKNMRSRVGAHVQDNYIAFTACGF
jgi:hypothetical protein